MINFDATALKLFLDENYDFITGARIQKIQQPTRKEFVFTLRNTGETRKLYININPNFFHLCFMSKENEDKRFIEIPKSPPMFCMLLRKYIENAKIAKINQPKDGDFLERILEFYFEVQNELFEKIYLCLAIELMGKHSNIALYNYDTNVLIGCAHNVGAEKSREREMMGGLPYVYPKKLKNIKYYGLSDLFKDNAESLSNSINSNIDEYFADLQNKEKIKTTKSKLLSLVNSKLKKIKSAFDKIQKQNKTSDKADFYRKTGDLIMANLFHNKDFSPYIDVFDYETNSPLKIELDKTKTLKENANKYYKLYNKAKTTSTKALELLENLNIEKEYFEQVIFSVNEAENLNDLFEIQEEINESIYQAKKDKNIKNKTQKEFKINEFTVFIGKNNKQNDFIISKLARDEDLWFHIKDCAGSHVLLKLENGIMPDEKTIFECAKLAKENSSAKLSPKAAIIYTKRKFIKKPPGAKLGYVTYKEEREIIV